MKKTLLIILLFLSFLSTAGWAAENSPLSKELRILRITPQGEDVPAGRQIVIEFNRPVVPVGRMDRSKEQIPATITPLLNCHWRWLNTSALACNLDEENALKPATKYTLVVNPGIKTEDGATLAASYQHSFITERPDIEYANVADWTAPGTPIIYLYTKQPTTKESLRQRLVFTLAADQKKPYEVVVTKRDLAQEKSRMSEEDESATATALKKSEDPNTGKEWQITSKKELPWDSKITLRLMPGLVSTLGSEKGVRDKEVLSFNTFPAFKFLGLHCSNNAGKDILITENSPQKPGELCNPLGEIALSFNTPVLRSQIYKNFDFTPNLANGSKEVWNLDEEHSRLNNRHEKDDFYNVGLPAIQAAQSYSITTKTAGSSGLLARVWDWINALFKEQPLTNITDEFGRKLSKPIAIQFTTDHRLPNFEMVYQNAVLEKATDSEVPLYVNNLESIRFNYRSVKPGEEIAAQSISREIPKVQDIQFAIPLGIRQMLRGSSGAIYGQLTTQPEVKKSPESAYTLFAQVTPYQVHVKLGHFNTLVWVTDLATGLAVADAKVTIYPEILKNMGTPHDVLATALTDSSGTAVLPGTQILDPDLKLMRQWENNKSRLFVRVDKGQDMALMPLSYDFSIDTWRATDSTTNSGVYTDSRQKYGHMVAWGTTAQGIYRLGDTMQYKLYVRNQDNKTLVPAPASGYTLQILDATNKVVDEIKDIQLSEFGAYSGEFTIPKEAAVGWYSFNLIVNFASPAKRTASDDSSNNITLSPMRVLVSDFTPSSFKVTNEVNGSLFRSGQTIEVITAAKLHSGGAYTDASARVNAILARKIFAPENELTKGFTFDSYTEQTENKQVYQNIALLDNKGELHTKFSIPKQKIVYGKLTLESAVQDDRGKYVASQTQADYAGVDRFVGLKTTEWVYNAQKPATIQYIVVDEQGNAVKDVPVDIQIEHQITNAARIKDAGNAYVTNYVDEWKVESTCKGTSETQPLSCQFTPAQAGSYRVTAKIKDTQGNIDSTQTSLWVVGKNYVLWNDQSDTYLPIVPEKKTYQVGDTARYLIKNPYPGAKALITIERYGVMDRFVQTLDSSSPVIEFPIKPDYLPGFYLSVLVVSPRVEKPLENAQVDLGKPTFRMGYVAVPVNDPYKALRVSAKTDQSTYRPRDKVTLQLHVGAKSTSSSSKSLLPPGEEPAPYLIRGARRADEGAEVQHQPLSLTPNPSPDGRGESIELAVAVLDEAVFDLLANGRDYYDPYKGFYHLDALDLQNYSLLTRLIGRQKFEKKGANPGGDGGIDLGARNFFKFVSYWNPSIKPDAQGNATVTFEAPDNLTGWRVLVMAATPTDHLGLGEANFKVNRPTEVRPVMPNQVMEGDDFKAGFSVMNRTDKTRTLQVEINAQGHIDTAKSAPKYQQAITLEPYKRMTVWMPITVANLTENAAINTGEIKFTAKAGDNTDTDSVEYNLPVSKMRSLETVADYGTTIKDHALVSIAFPDKIYTDMGGVNVISSPSVIANVAGAFKYLRDYPYECWEQKLTKGAMAAHYKQLKDYFPADFVWEKSADLPQQTLDLAANAQAPNGGMTFYIAQDQYVDPYLSAYTALAFNWLRQDGYSIPTQVESRLQDYLLNFLRRDVAPDYYSDGMKSTVRAVALAALADQGKITLDDLQRYMPVVKQMSLFGKAYFVQAALQVKGAENMVTETTQSILSHADQSAGKFIFSEALDDGYQRILSSPLRENCAILSTLTRVEKTEANKNLVSDIPFKLMSTITQTRKNRDHWENTQENMFCMQALVDYSRAYENTPPKMTVGVNLNNRPLGETQFNSLQDAPVTFTNPMQKDDPGRKSSIEISRQGEGRLYYITQINFAQLEQTEAVNAGMDIQREYSVQREGKWLLLKNPLQIKQGELVRVDIYLSLPAARNFVVVDDTVPGGLEPVNRDLATASIVDADAAKFIAAEGSAWFKFKDWSEYNTSRWNFYHQELHHDAVRYYSDYLPAGNYHLSYTAQAIAAGDFSVLPVKAEEMYNPDIFGKGISEHLLIK